MQLNQDQSQNQASSWENQHGHDQHNLVEWALHVWGEAWGPTLHIQARSVCYSLSQKARAADRMLQLN